MTTTPLSASKEEIPSFHDSLKVVKRAMELYGVWPEENEKNFLYYWKIFSIIAQYLLSLGFLFAQWSDLYIFWGDIDAMTDNISNNIITINGVVKLTYILLKRKSLQEVIHMMRVKWDEITKHAIAEQRELLLENSRIVWSLVSKYIIFMASTVTFYSFVPFIYQRDGIEMGYGYPFRAYYHYGRNSIVAYGFYYVVQIFTGIAVGGINCTIDSFYTIAIYQFAAQLRILQNNIEHYGGERHTTFKSLSMLIDKHNMDIRDIRKLEGMISATSLQQLLVSCIFICVTGFKVITCFRRRMFVFGGLYLIFMVVALIQIFLYCFAGQELMTQSIAISDAAYNSLWFNMPPTAQQHFRLIILRAHRPLACTAMNVYDLCLPNFTSIVKTAGSFMSLLNAMYKE